MKRKTRISVRIEEKLVIRGVTSPEPPKPEPGSLTDYLDSLLQTGLLNNSNKKKDEPPCNEE